LRNLHPLCDRLGREQVASVVAAQYRCLRARPDIGTLFAALDAAHEAKIADFWWQAFGGRLARPVHFDMLGRHRALPLDAAAFDAWFACLDTALGGLPDALAADWRTAAGGIGATLRRHAGVGA
jgi:truncated hemoglobin YjbI